METSPTLRPYQIADLAFLINKPNALLGNEPGTGKTPTACMYSKYRLDHHREKSIWVQPKSLMGKNRAEIIRFTGLDPDDVVVLQGTPKKRQELMASGAKVFLTTFAGWGNEYKDILAKNPELKTMIVDESHMGYAGNSSKRTEAMYLASRKMNSNVFMTGTIIKGRLSSAYPVLHVIAPQFYGNYNAFMMQHAIKDEYGSLIGWRNHEKLRNVLKAVGVFRSFESVYGKEAKVIEIEKCEMSPKHREIYQELETTALIELEDEFIDAGNPAVAAMRARQLMAHPEFFGLDVGELGKDERLWIHIEDAIQAEEPLVIFSSLVPEQERIYKQLQARGCKVALINGNVSGPQRVKIDEQFRAGTIQFVVGSPATMSVGFNWGHIDTVVFVSLDYEDSNFVQAYRRGIRGVRTKPLRILVLEYLDSIDQRIFEIVQRKSRDASMVDDTKNEIKLLGM